MSTELKLRIYITLKSGILDPQGKTIQQALDSLGYSEVEDVRAGKLIELTLNGSNRDNIDARVKEMCEKLFANPVIEDYAYEIVEN